MSSQPATTVETAGSVQAPLHRSIPDEIVVWEILVRLPPKALLRCRAICPAWRRATSTRDFLLAHHTRQPSLPIIYHYEFGDRFCGNIINIDHRSADAQVHLVASCDGLLVHSDSDGYFSICNPATHQYAPLLQQSVLPCRAVSGYAELFEMGDMLGMACFVMEDNGEYAERTIDIFVMKDYESQVWAFKCRIELRVEEISMQCENCHNFGNVVVMPVDRELFLLVQSEDCIHHVDINGKLVASFYRGGLGTSELRLKQTLVQHTFFSSLESYVVNDSPFIWRSNFSFLVERYDQEALALNVVV